MAQKPCPVDPIGLQRTHAAFFVGVSAGTFDTMVKTGVMPQPRRYGARKIWDRRELEIAFEDLPSDTDPAEKNDWD